MQQIADWLEKLGMSQYAACFAENDVDFSLLPELTDQDLEKVGVASLGHRRKLLRAIAELGVTPSAEPTARGGVGRRQLTVMFCDLVGSTAISTRLDPEDLREVISAFQRCCRNVIVESGGFVARYMGDGVLAYFGYPKAHETDAERAIRAALALVAAVPKLGVDASLQVRAGIATGLVVVGDLIAEDGVREEAGVGETFNLAARLQTLAEPNTAVIDGTTRRLIGGLYECRSLGKVPIRGFADPIPVWQVTGPSAVYNRFEALRASITPMVNREEEIDLLMRRWQQAKTGDGSIVLILGEPGIGKSRIVQTILEQLHDDPHTRMRYFCSPHHQDSPLYPAIAQLARAAGFRRDDTAEQRLDKLEVVLAQGTTNVKEVAPLFAELLSIPASTRYPPLELSPARLKQRTLQAKVAQVEGLASRGPLLMVCEDVHWSDATSLELLDLIIDRVPNLPILLIITFRPEFSARWIGRPRVTLLSLSRLSPRQRAELIAGVTAGKTLPKDVMDQIIDRTDGVPLFIEELTKAVVESGVLAELDAGFTKAVPAQPLAIPTTLQASLLARLDRLAPVREVAQIAATLGRHFSHELISAVARIPQGVLDNALAQLVEAELIYRRGIPPDAVYTFKHALVQDAAYQSLLRSKRQQYHLQIADVLERRFPEIVETQPELVAHHYTEADFRSKAVPYWQTAGQKAVRRSASAEAINHFNRGLELLKALPTTPERSQQELALLVALGTPLIDTKGFGSAEVISLYARARQLCQEVGGVRQLFPVLWGVWVSCEAQAEHKAALELGEQCQHLAEQAADPELLIAAHHARGVTLMSLGELGAALEHLQQVIALYNPQQHRARALMSGIACRSQAAFALWLLGRPDQAITKNDEALALAQELSRPYSLAQASAFAAVFCQLLRNPAMAREHADAAIALSTEHEFPFFRAMGVIIRGWTLAETIGPNNAIAEIHQGLVELRAAGGEITRPYYLAILSELYGHAGVPERGLEALTEAQAAVESSGERCWEAELWRRRGELMLKCADGQRADREIQLNAQMCFCKALDIAHRQNAKSFELRAAVSLGRLLRRKGNRGEAFTMLAEIYASLTEGFSTADLQEAKTLLAELE
jgi:predicted ATPase/class 3 adenylate cyclase